MQCADDSNDVLLQESNTDGLYPGRTVKVTSIMHCTVQVPAAKATTATEVTCFITE